ncbi:hypothetical protein ASF11_09245 [Acidovorax sp. Leaf76]|nr:hypothetical protein ASF11_09245 [Acidovorax sp. Leaf76]KQO32428.1 hypothetical protein ASF19_08075 [Acidovorax sp. Leaf84]KQS31995.1 hypothetical protein ASG27_08365 [Acidovorax sp. Leaf191]
MWSECLLLLALSVGGLHYLYPYWKVMRSSFEHVSEPVQFQIGRSSTAESLEPLFELTASVQTKDGREQRIEVFPWHSDNVFRTREEAEEAIARACALTSGKSSTIVVGAVLGSRKYVSSHISPRARREIAIWSSVAAGVGVFGLFLGWHIEFAKSCARVPTGLAPQI